MNRWPRHRRTTSLLLGAVLTAVTLSACGGGTEEGSGSNSITEEDIQAALDKPTTLTVWSWSGSLPDVAKAFEKKYPKIKVKVENVGTGAEQYAKLQNAIKAGKGAPDLATVEYNAIPQYALTGALVDLKKFGFDSLEDRFDPAVWANVNVDGGLFELPLNAGPMALFYNKKTFDKFDIEVPTTWDEYIKAARKIQKADPDYYIGADTGNAGLTESLIWAADGRPFKVDGASISIDLQDAGSKKYAEMYQQLLDDKLLSSVGDWSPEWFEGLASGRIATLSSGAWMAGILKGSVAKASGDWRVAPMPSYDGESTTSINGGGSLAMPEQGDNQLVAAAFLRYVSAEEGADITQASGSFPARAEVLESEKFLDAKDEYFGGQRVNRVFAESLRNVATGWQYLPYDVYAVSIFNDNAGKAYTGDSTILKGLKSWEQALVRYGEEQGFTIN
ncbi:MULTISPECIES: ABC transporter substrate-binding protein [Streptomyces]|uniref:Sugar ABC transporter substrate-binding protein n=1 Tax=Streptomyces cadmiisoli TaxID=2184053 RepID=A0A2Z4JDC8_9ACTN|nr:MULTISPECIES: sugar ABC transporter substrate-binding protein [Streptomyces]AWW43162.1 sugar ABC transporter substrate-binding protein [Streptomyces cadmiisoli]